ncbi:DUF4234 domain-containing protein [Nocardioides sp. SYSU D00038]|uniref:DUF4234 domain-containing protein n=1 Tax=Nocardioides sp. SYSU D00038 TaxID=2812554 RepID=UPI001967E56F|nr:DUF4234 domain-containing protein [Nocardioides sp. SYSU D00038]
MPPQSPPPAPAGYGAPPAPAQHGPIGKVRGTGACIGLTIITLGIYSLVWYYSVHEEMKRHTGQGVGGVVGLVLALFVGVVSPFLVASEVGRLYTRSGQQAPVSGATGLWYIPGFLILVGPIVWFVKTNGALNSYWRSQGAR